MTQFTCLDELLLFKVIMCLRDYPICNSIVCVFFTRFAELFKWPLSLLLLPLLKMMLRMTRGQAIQNICTKFIVNTQNNERLYIIHPRITRIFTC